jgi:hypothetical protein
MAPQFGGDNAGIARQQQADLEMPRGDERTVHDEGRARIAAHCVYGDTHGSPETGD